VSEQRATYELAVPTVPAVRTRGTASIVLGLAACILVLTLAVAGVHARIGTPPSEHAFTVGLAYLVIASFGLTFVVGVALAAAVRPQRQERRRLSSGQQLLVAFVVLALVAAPLIGVAHLLHGVSWKPTPAAAHRVSPLLKQQRHPIGRAPLRVDWALFTVAGVGALLGVLGLTVLLRRDTPSPQATTGAKTAEAVGFAIDELEDEVDPRRAVIRAYAAMEGSLAKQGLPRRATETPFEYLVRILERARPAARLTALFEQAKFSDHKIGEDMAREALGALRDLRAELER
jgi:MFS family permease